MRANVSQKLLWYFVVVHYERIIVAEYNCGIVETSILTSKLYINVRLLKFHFCLF